MNSWRVLVVLLPKKQGPVSAIPQKLFKQGLYPNAGVDPPYGHLTCVLAPAYEVGQKMEPCSVC